VEDGLNAHAVDRNKVHLRTHPEMGALLRMILHEENPKNRGS